MFNLPNLFPYHFISLPEFPEIAYLDEGPRTAPVLLFLHGLGDDSRNWNLTIQALSKNFRCLAPDLPGHGQSPATGFGFRMFDFANLVENFMAALQIRNFSLTGHSMGGQISIILSLRQPALINKMVLVATAGFERFTEAEKHMLQSGASFNPLPDLGGTATLTAKVIRHTALTRSMAAMLDEPVFSFLPQITVPTLVIFGEQDGFIPNRFLHPQTTAEVARSGASQIPGAELLLIPRCNHYPQLEKPHQFATAVEQFVKFG